LAAAAQGRQHGTFGGYCCSGAKIFQALRNVKRRAAIVASFYGERSLPNGWTHYARIEDFGDPAFQTQAPQSC
jgi:hypothetical protein